MEVPTPGDLPASIAVELTPDELGLAATRARTGLLRRARGPRAAAASVAFWLFIGGLGALGYRSLNHLGLDTGFALLALAALVVVAIALRALRQRRRVDACYRENLPNRYSVTADADGLRVASDDGDARYRWSAVTGVEAGDAGLMLLFSGHRALWLPARSFADGEARQAFAARIAAGVGKPIGALDTPPQPLQAGDFGVRAFLRNLAAGCGFLLLRADAVGRLRVSASQFVATVVAGLIVTLAFDLVRVGWQGSFNLGALPVQMYGVPWLLLAAWGASSGGRLRSPLAGALALSVIWLIAGTLLTAWVTVAPKPWAPAWLRVEGGAYFVWLGVVGWSALASIVALVRVFGLPPEERMAAVLSVLLLLMLPLMLVQNEEHLWISNARDARSDPAQQAAWKRRQLPAGEATIYAQNKVLEEALAAVKPGVPGKPELFLIAVGGDGSQDVFRREVASVSQLFAERFGTAGHSLALVNNPDTVLSQPIASVTALRRAVQVMGLRMNPEEDVLFLFMTSHGSQDHRFYLNLWPYQFDELTPTVLSAMLDEAGVKYRVVVVSACYSGGFVPPLAGDNTLVISASRADRNSHGCSHEAEWTFFGKAYFDEALRNERSFEAAFADAAMRVAKRESAEGVTPSEPQIAVGEGIRRALKPFDGKG